MENRVLLILNVRLERSNRVSILLIRALSLFQHLKQIAESHEGQGEFEPETLLRIIVDEALGNSDRTFGVLAAFALTVKSVSIGELVVSQSHIA